MPTRVIAALVLACAVTLPSMGSMLIGEDFPATARAQSPIGGPPEDPTVPDEDIAFACAAARNVTQPVTDALGRAPACTGTLGCDDCPPPCRTSIVSDSNTTWTHYNQGGAADAGGGAEGFNVASVAIPTSQKYFGWAQIPASTWTTGLPTPKYIWKEPGLSGTWWAPAVSQSVTRLPVMFERTFRSCLNDSVPPEITTLSIIGDDAFLVVFNDQPLTGVTSCGQLYYNPSKPNIDCWSWVHTFTLTLKQSTTADPIALNRVVFYGFNHQGPAMIQYKIDY